MPFVAVPSCAQVLQFDAVFLLEPRPLLYRGLRAGTLRCGTLRLLRQSVLQPLNTPLESFANLTDMLEIRTECHQAITQLRAFRLEPLAFPASCRRSRSRHRLVRTLVAYCEPADALNSPAADLLVRSRARGPTAVTPPAVAPSVPTATDGSVRSIDSMPQQS
jgi:hypothetical protein